MEIELVLDQKSGSSVLNFTFSRMINAGYVGRNQDEVRRHIEELALKGIPGPKTTPVLFPVVCRMLVTDTAIEVLGAETSGEVEYVLLVKNENEIYVGLGSDHTDRHLEETDIPRSKQINPNVIARTVWPLNEVKDHWDDLLIRSYVTRKGEKIPYQEGRLGLIMDPAGLMDFIKKKIPGPIQDAVIYSGTLGTLSGGFVFGERFSAELVDEKLDRILSLAYDVRPLDYLEVE